MTQAPVDKSTEIASLPLHVVVNFKAVVVRLLCFIVLVIFFRFYLDVFL